MTKMEMVTTTRRSNGNGSHNSNNIGALSAPQPPQDVETAVPVTQARAVVDEGKVCCRMCNRNYSPCGVIVVIVVFVVVIVGINFAGYMFAERVTSSDDTPPTSFQQPLVPLYISIQNAYWAIPVFIGIKEGWFDELGIEPKIQVVSI